MIQDIMNLSPQQIVERLDGHIVGQAQAKRAVAIALRNRFRRLQVPGPMRSEITPKNILMIGPTGVGKTEIARRLAKLDRAPFIKVEATKFTEVGYVGRDVDSIIRDLVEISIKLARDIEMDRVKHRAMEAAELRLLDALMAAQTVEDDSPENANAEGDTRQQLQAQLREGLLNEQDVELDVARTAIGVEIMAPPGMEEMTHQLQSIFQSLSADRSKRRKFKVAEALKLVQEEEAAKLINDEDLKSQAIARVEQAGIVFIDEIDKVTQRSELSGGDVSREGVQRDLLPLIEGCTVSTKYGMVKTDHILFIASGAFHVAKPSDLIPELQGRFPIRVELDALNTADFVRILTEPKACLTEQYKALLKTEGVELTFDTRGIERLAELAWQINERTENIGARRLHTVMERLLEDISFRATELKGQTLTIDDRYVDDQLCELVKDEDLSQFIL